MGSVCFLLTSVGRRVELVRHFLSYAEEHPGRLRVLGTEIDPHAPAAQLLGDHVRLVPRSDEAGYGSSLQQVCEVEGVDAVFPLIDPDVSALAGTDLPVGGLRDREVAAVVSDKWSTYEWLRGRGIPTVSTWLPGQRRHDSFPVFMKPRKGSGGEDAFQVRDPDEYAFFSRYITAPVAQELLPGPELTVDVVVGRDREVLALAQRERLAVRGGEVSRGRLVHADEVERVVRHVVTELRPGGPITVQGMYDRHGTFRVTEINARMGGGLPLAIAAGVPLARLLVESWAGERPREVRNSDLSIGLHMARFDDAFYWHP
ncbi:ATP-grasp domain-containing protein [Ornithinimicrobium sediminis]|uniref:ATP-grasp domain-containing protein n=1 Tax=Ornithinimicrobium sediminis TaxID=2904603 RepID=UPI001E426823|nr:ATP-grasp domain-containing protein [Ornithinimicrobium sediminis]MCE0485991.1 ATP-grasp domain-containing protein [Ornithinimicrobium sediminis]